MQAAAAKPQESEGEKGKDGHSFGQSRSSPDPPAW